MASTPFPRWLLLYWPSVPYSLKTFLQPGMVTFSTSSLSFIRGFLFTSTSWEQKIWAENLTSKEIKIQVLTFFTTLLLLSNSYVENADIINRSKKAISDIFYETIRHRNLVRSHKIIYSGTRIISTWITELDNVTSKQWSRFFYILLLN